MRSPDRQFAPHYTMPKRKGKFYICVTVPKELRPFYSENQIRRSTGTLDKAVANERAQKKYIELLNDLEQKASLLDPFIEGLRHILEASGVEVSEWYTKGTLSKEFVGQNTIAFELTGKTTHLVLALMTLQQI